MTYCIRCGTILFENARYCSMCNGKIENAERKNFEMEKVNELGMVLNYIPAGEFNMGSNGWDDTRPCHNVFIEEPFYIGKKPVTQWEWEVLMGGNPAHFIGDEHPVEMVSWRDCQEFIDRLNMLEGTDRYRLPSEMEWEYACRAGDPKDYYFNNDVDRLEKYAWFLDNSELQTHDVGQKKPNKWGLHDMLGNVWEWCEDNWHDSYIGAPRDRRPWSIREDYYHVDRGGSWDSSGEKCISTCRDWNMPGDHASYIGFRLAFSP